jgi:peroxiredoxin
MKNIFNKSTILISMVTFFLIANSHAVLAEEDEPSEGQIAPDFAITQMDGSQFKLSDYRGKQPVYLVFWNTWCTYCMKKIPKLKDAQANLSDKIKVIAVNTGLKDSVEKSIIFQKRFNINYPLAFDHNKRVTDLYGVWGTPTEFIIDINGIIQHRDGVPDEIRPHLAEWQTVIEHASTIADTTTESECQSQGAKTC